MLGPMMTARKLEKQQGPESHGRDIDQMGAEDGPKQSSNNAARPRGSQYRTAPKLGKIGTGCGTIGGLLRQHQNLRAPGPGTHSKPGTRKGKAGSEIAPPARKIGVMTGSGKATGIAPPRALLHRIQLVGASRRAQTMSRGARAASRCGTKGMQAVRLPPVAQAQANQGTGQPIRGPTTERDGQLGVAQTDEDCEQGEATHPP